MEIQFPYWNYVRYPPPYDEWLDVAAGCRVRFTTFEQLQMQLGARFGLTCRLKGADGNGVLDLWYADVLFEFGPVLLPQNAPFPYEHVSFWANVRSSALDEDEVTWNDHLDDVFADFLLIDLRDPQNGAFDWAAGPIRSEVF